MAFQNTQSQRAALDPSELAPINVDIPRAVSTALGTLGALRELRPAILEHLPKHRLDALDRLGELGLAAWFAHLRALPRAGAPSTAQLLVDEATPLRQHLLVAAEALAHVGLVESAKVAEIRSGAGHVDLAGDLVALAALFSDHWDEVCGKTAVRREDIERAATLGPELLVAAGERESTQATSTAEAQDQRARAFTLFLRAYDECRRAVSYLRWREGDANAITPSLFANRSGSRKPGADTGEASSRETTSTPTGAP